MADKLHNLSLSATRLICLAADQRVQWRRAMCRIGHVLCFGWMLLATLWSPMTIAQDTTNSSTTTPTIPADLSSWISQAGMNTGIPGVNRIEVELGQLDPRLKLAPCQKIQPHVPVGAKLWGRSRVGLRCVQGSVLWNVYLPVQIKVYGPALVTVHSLPAGATLQASDLRIAEVDLASDPSPVVASDQNPVGRVVAQALNAGESVRQRHLQQRRWFSAGDPVRINAKGSGFVISQEGIAITPGLEGQVARIRTENGRIVVAYAVAERTAEVSIPP